MVTKNSIELYSTNWQNKVSLLVTLALNEERIYSVQWDEAWHLFGEFKQYSHKKVRLWSIRNIDEEYPSCFLGPLQYLVNNKNLAVYDHKKKKHQTINWPEAGEYIPSIQRNKAVMKIH